MLRIIFNFISPQYSSNWFSRKYYIWLSNRRDEENERIARANKDNSRYFEVKGAGNIQISESCHNSVGDAVGFSFAVEWGDNGLVGGVIGRGEAIKMAEFILEKCSTIKVSEQEELDMVWREILKMLNNLEA